MFNFVANASAVTSLVAIGAEAGKNGAKQAKKSAQTSLAVYDIKNVTGDLMLNERSEKHNAMKSSLRDKDLLSGFHRIGGSISGFGTGVVDALNRNLPQLGFSALTLICKSKPMKTIGTVGLLASTAWDFLKNGTNLFTKTDIIED